jgi:hypothetical protein
VQTFNHAPPSPKIFLPSSMPQQRRGMETRKGNWGEGGMNVIKVIKYMNESVITKPIIFNIIY